MDKWYAKYPDVKNGYWQRIIKFARKYGFTRSLVMHKRHLPDMNSSRQSVRRAAERLAINNPIQGAGALIGMEACNRLARIIGMKNLQDKMKICSFIHDAIVCLVREDFMEEGQKIITWAMTKINYEQKFLIDAMRVPLTVDVEFSRTLSSDESKKVYL